MFLQEKLHLKQLCVNFYVQCEQQKISRWSKNRKSQVPLHVSPNLT